VKRRVILESPYAGDVQRNVAYAEAALADSLKRGEAPFASHLLYTRVLDDTIPSERGLGIGAGFAWGAVAEACVVYRDLGITKGMQMGIDRAHELGIEVEMRNLSGWRSPPAGFHPKPAVEEAQRRSFAHGNVSLSNPDVTRETVELAAAKLSGAFREFPKIPRLRREVVVTEKIDGTNGVIHVTLDGVVRAGSRTRWITPENDNHGFARWVQEHADELRLLGAGLHYGEWWGAGINRGYGLKEKRFSLFNVARWGLDRPACCHVVPTVAAGEGVDAMASKGLDVLLRAGSLAAPGFPKPEGVVVFHTASKHMYKVTLEKDEAPKGQAR